jgi:hypothetical protein
MGRHEILGDNEVSVSDKQKVLNQTIVKSLQDHMIETNRINKNIDESRKRGSTEPYYHEPLLVTDDEYKRLLPPYKKIVDKWMSMTNLDKKPLLTLYSKRNPNTATYFLILEPRPDHPRYSIPE